MRRLRYGSWSISCSAVVDTDGENKTTVYGRFLCSSCSSFVVVVDSIVVTVLAVAETVDKNLSILGVIRDCGGSFCNCLVEFKQKPPSDTKVPNFE